MAPSPPNYIRLWHPPRLECDPFIPFRLWFCYRTWHTKAYVRYIHHTSYNVCLHVTKNVARIFITASQLE